MTKNLEIKKLLNDDPEYANFFKASTFIDASAGTGKTYTIENLVAKLLDVDGCKVVGNRPVSLSEILVVTFTKKAAGELQNRIEKAIRERYNQHPSEALKKAINEIDIAPIFTIDAFCNQVLSEYSFEANFASGASIASDDDLLSDLVERDCRDYWKDEEEFKILISQPRDDKKDPYTPRNLISYVTQLAKGYVKGDVEIHDTPEESLVAKFCNSKAKRIHEMWRQEKNRALQLNFTDLRNQVRKECLAKNSKLLNLLKKRYRYGIIDEFQDTDLAQWEIFSKIFLEDKDHVIYMVGDPKQSIYSFRGGNVEVYLKALDDIRQASTQDDYKLSYNFRSAKAIIDADNAVSAGLMRDINAFFEGSEMGEKEKRESFFFAKEKGEKIESPFRIFSYAEDPMCVKGPNGSSKFKPKPGFETRAERAYYNWIVQQILGFNISDGKSTIEIPKNDHKADSGYSYINYSDIAILGRTGKELDSVARVLRSARIPCVRYRDEALFDGTPAVHWATLLKGIECINSRKSSDVTAICAALLTVFFDVDLATIQNTDDFDLASSENVSKAIQIMKNLHACIKQREWGNFVEKIFRYTDVEMRLAQRGDLENLSKIRQIADYVTEYLYSENTTLAKLSRHLKQVNAGLRSPIGQDEKIIGKDTEVPQVKLMTMHVSKGLQFPVVFVAGGIRLNPPTKMETCVYNKVVDGKTLIEREISLVMKEVNYYDGCDPKSLAEKQIKDEWHNLFYVACTRAKFLCYAPECHVNGNIDNDESFLSDILRGVFENPNVEVIKAERNNTFTNNADVSERISVGIKDSSSGVTANSLLDELRTEQSNVVKSMNPSVTMHNNFILSTQSSSYSALSKTNKYDKPNPADVDADYKKEESVPKILQFPSNNKIGSGLHRIFELINYQDGGRMFDGVPDETLSTALDDEIVLKELFEGLSAKPENKAIRDLIISSLRINGASDKYAPHCALIVYNTLNAKFNLDDQEFSLKELEDWARRHEMNFDMNSFLIDADHVKFAECNQGDQVSHVMFNGSIDLLFRHNVNGKMRWYILDWKSNRLPENVAYTADNIWENMRADKYDLQQALYSKVFLEWYRKFGNKDIEKVYDEEFGGVIYCYLRGCKKDKPDGFRVYRWENFKAFTDDLNEQVVLRYRRLAMGKTDVANPVDSKQGENEDQVGDENDDN